MSDSNPIRFDVQDGIATVTLDRPEYKNALSWQAMDGLTDAWQRAEDDPVIRVIILTSADCGVFCAGMDLKQAAELKACEGVDLITKARDPMQANMRSVTKPIIAAMTGSLMAGGMMLALNCDLRVGLRGTRAGITEVKIGRGSPWAVPLLWMVPQPILMEMVLTGETMPIERLLDCGFIDYIEEYGTTAEQLAEAAVVMRRHASRTPGAQQTKLITVDDVLSSPMMTTPYHRLDCSLISDGAAAFILVPAGCAKALGVKKPIYILGAGECYTHEHISLMPSLTSTGAIESSRKAYAMAGYGPRDMSTAGVYDCFTDTLIMMLEDLGFCQKGEGGPFVEDGQITYGGKMPVNTHGGLLSFAHPGMPGALFHFHEVIQQLRGDCGERQVANAHLALVHALGAGFATNVTTILGMEHAL